MCWFWAPFSRQGQGNDVYPKHDSTIYSIRWFCKKPIFDLPIMLPERSRKHLEKGALANTDCYVAISQFFRLLKNYGVILQSRKPKKNQPFFAFRFFITEMLPFHKFGHLWIIYWKLYCKCTTLLVYTVSFFFNLSPYAVIFFSGHLWLGILKFPGQRPGVLLVLIYYNNDRG